MIKRGNGFKDMTGESFNGCKVISYVGTKNRRAVWKCICFCGEEFEAVGTQIRNGHKKSCGCLRSKVTTEKNYKHGKVNTRLYTIWSGMKARCNNVKHPAYDRYGGRGIKVCEEWEKSFEEFEKWAKNNGYEKHLTIDRINNDEGYSPDNCQWSDYYQQARNKSNNSLSLYKGKMRTRGEIAELTGLTYSAVRGRQQDGIDFDKPKRKHINGKYVF